MPWSPQLEAAEAGKERLADSPHRVASQLPPPPLHCYERELSLSHTEGVPGTASLVPLRLRAGSVPPIQVRAPVLGAASGGCCAAFGSPPVFSVDSVRQVGHFRPPC